MGSNLTSNHSHTRPTAFGLSVTFPLNPTICFEASVTTGVAAWTTERRKRCNCSMMANTEILSGEYNELGWVCVLLVVESYGAWGKEALESISQLS